MSVTVAQRRPPASTSAVNSAAARDNQAGLLRLLTRAMGAPEELVVELIYLDSKGTKTRRVVSPIRYLGKDRFLGLCLCRCEPRQFYLTRCLAARLRPAADFVMPVPMQVAS
ncbi:MAG: hypothetical protein KatS3mg111_3745 [Pirellulaceae bacterium]|nr:MAG: hypothetical protein KatS3mg111_3745 [Pirellulaceae bacterium]